ncbi:transferase [Streptomyces broussonetiae]|uniref:Transferase n=1 Tax=Streptomyces broussonetiae TaxID=2686304 RepID=A0ABV5E3Y2_9ACTN
MSEESATAVGAKVTTEVAGPRTHCTIDADGRIVFLLAADTPASQLLLRLRPKKGQPEKTLHTLGPEATDDGRLRAVLEPEPVLPEGRWDLYLLAGPDAPRQRLRPGLRDLRVLVDGQGRDRPSPVAVRIPYATKDGYLALRTWLRAVHAEVERMDAAERSLTVRARLHGATLTAPSVVLRPRGGKGVVRTVPADAEDDGRGVTFTVDYGALAADDADKARIWDLSVRTDAAEGGPGVRLARLLDDVADRKGVFVYPESTVGDATVRPYYTVDNDLSVQVTPGRVTPAG